VHVEACVHAGYDGHAPGRGQRQIPLLERLGVSRVVLEQLICYAHLCLHVLSEALAYYDPSCPSTLPS
jgi:hypothetical protein